MVGKCGTWQQVPRDGKYGERGGDQTMRYGLGLRKKPTDGRFAVDVKTRTGTGLVGIWPELGNERTVHNTTKQTQEEKKRNGRSVGWHKVLYRDLSE